MALVVWIGEHDWARCRFAISRPHQVAQALRALRTGGPTRDLPHLAHLAGQPDPGRWEPLLRLMPDRAWGVDFLTPPPGGARDAWPQDLERLRATPPTVVADEVRRCLEPQGLAVPAGSDAALRDALVGLLDEAWHVLVEPVWPWVHDVLAADIARRGGRLAEGGLGAVLADLTPGVSLVGSSIVLGRGPDQQVHLAGRGLLLLPHAYGTREGFLWEEPWAPTLVYGAAGAAASAAEREAGGLRRLLGATRAQVLLALDEPATTTGLATRCGLPLSSASDHLAVLRSAGLVTATRRRYALEHRRTPLGEAVVNGAAPPA